MARLSVTDAVSEVIAEQASPRLSEYLKARTASALRAK